MSKNKNYPALSRIIKRADKGDDLAHVVCLCLDELTLAYITELKQRDEKSIERVDAMETFVNSLLALVYDLKRMIEKQTSKSLNLIH